MTLVCRIGRPAPAASGIITPSDSQSSASQPLEMMGAVDSSVQVDFDAFVQPPAFVPSYRPISYEYGPPPRYAARPYHGAAAYRGGRHNSPNYARRDRYDQQQPQHPEDTRRQDRRIEHANGYAHAADKQERTEQKTGTHAVAHLASQVDKLAIDQTALRNTNDPSKTPSHSHPKDYPRSSTL